MKKTRTTLANVITSIGDLAGMVARGFEDNAQRFGVINSRLDTMDSRLGFLEVGQEDIKLRLDNAAYKFEMKELERRLEVVEKKVGTAAV